MECENLSVCPFFNDKLPNMPKTTSLLKTRYCLGDYNSCARYIVFKALGREKVPRDLWPSEIERAQKILEENKVS
jgi:hypothetical protein